MIKRTGLLVLLGIACFAAPVQAAESYDNCTGFIDSLPATISTQGTWCLRKHLYTSMTSGAAISVLTDNVTVDCNHFRLSGLGAGVGTNAVGISAGASRLNATVRQCRIQGFKYGVVLYGAGHQVEYNRFDLNTYTGIHVTGDANEIRGNVINDTGGRPGEVTAFGINAEGSGARVVDNSIQGVTPVGDGTGDKFSYGIIVRDGLAQGNRIAGLAQSGNPLAAGIVLYDRSIARDNLLQQPASTNGYGIYGSGAASSVCQGNTAQAWALEIANCQLVGDNGIQP
ncbi:MAG TPA: right-handed parallel beta-helix repeat-containing protein [Lysobacter sp.]